MAERGFTDLAVDSAKAFRIIMTAMSRPACIHGFDTGIDAPPPLAVPAHAVALTLCDYQTPIYLAPQLRSAAVERYLRFHTGAPLTDSPQDAAYAFLRAETAAEALRSMSVGTHEYPDRSATVVVQCRAITGSGPVRLSGPGIKDTLSIDVEGLEAGAWQMLEENHGRFPLGFDTIFVAPRAIAALPRSTAITVREAA